MYVCYLPPPPHKHTSLSIKVRLVVNESRLQSTDYYPNFIMEPGQFAKQKPFNQESKLWPIHYIHDYRARLYMKVVFSLKTSQYALFWKRSFRRYKRGSTRVVSAHFRLVLDRTTFIDSIQLTRVQQEYSTAVLWNRNYLLRFRFWLLKRYGSGSNFWKVMVPVPTFGKVTIPVPVPAPYLDHKNCQKKFRKFFWLFT